MFLIYINDIDENILSQIKLFANDCLLYQVIKTEQDTASLQRDLDTLSHWALVWQMRFNLGKCTIMRCSRSLNPITVNYSIYRSILSVTHQHMYLGVTLDDHLSWSTHATNVASKATRMLNFLKCHLTKCSTDICILIINSTFNGMCCLGLTLHCTNNTFRKSRGMLQNGYFLTITITVVSVLCWNSLIGCQEKEVTKTKHLLPNNARHDRLIFT